MPPQRGFKLSDAATAAGVSVKALSRDLDRGVIEVPGPDPGKGHHRLLPLSTIYRIAIVYALTKLYVTPTAAKNLAAKFFESQRGRKPGKPFESGKTLMLVTNTTCSIINIEADQDVSSYLQDAAIVVDIGRIISNVNSRIFK